MLYLLGTLALILPTLLGWGFLATYVFPIQKRVSSYLVAGFVSLGFLWTCIAFFTGISIWIEVITILIGIGFFIQSKLYLVFWNFLKENYKIFLPFFGIILFAASFYPFILDHFGYYVPTIFWLREYGLVQGLSNLDLILGQMSTWHVIQAGFSNFTDPYLRLNTLMLLVYLIYALEKKKWIHFLILPILLLFVQSPSPDLPAIVFGLILVNELLNYNKNISSLFALSCFIILIKPTLIWAPLTVFLYGLFVLKKRNAWWIPGGCILLLFMIKNLWTFGYPVFPMTILDFNLPWKPNAELMQNSAKISIQKTFDMQFSVEQIQHFSFGDKVYHWFFLKGIKSIIHQIFALSLLVIGVFAFVRKSKTITILFVSILLKSLLIISVSAQYRFLLDVFFVIILMLFYQIKFKKTVLLASFGASFLLLSILFNPFWLRTWIPSFKLGHFMGTFKASQLIKPSEYSLKKFKTYQIGNLKFNVVDSYPFSFDTPLPAISPGFIVEYKDAGIFPQLKDGKNLKNGFIWKKINPEEKQKLEIILKNWEENSKKR